MESPQSPQKIILVTEALEKQGMAVIRCLLKDGWTVRALTRRRLPFEHAAMKYLLKHGVEVLEAGPEDRATLVRALAGVYGVYSVQSAEADADSTSLVNQAQLLIDVAKSAGVRHFVYSSAGGADRISGIPLLEAKWKIEQALHASGLPVSILRPSLLMEGFYDGGLANLLMISALSTRVRSDRALQLIAVDDIACFASIAFAQSEVYIGRTLELAGDALTLAQIVRIRRRIQGGQIATLPLPGFLISRRIPSDIRLLAEWLDREGYQADIDELRGIHPGLMTFEYWLNQKQARVQINTYRSGVSYAG